MPRGISATEPGVDLEPADFGVDPKRAVLRDDQQLAVGVDEQRDSASIFDAR